MLHIGEAGSSSIHTPQGEKSQYGINYYDTDLRGYHNGDVGSAHGHGQSTSTRRYFGGLKPVQI